MSHRGLFRSRRHHPRQGWCYRILWLFLRRMDPEHAHRMAILSMPFVGVFYNLKRKLFGGY